MRGESRTGGVDAALAVLAERQHGAVARRQLIELGLGAGAIDRRLTLGRLHLIHRGVYAVGHRRLTERGRWMAAVLATGPGAVLSYRSAASLWELVAPRSGAIEVTAPRECDRAGIKAHRTRLPRDEITLLDGIPVTTVPRTLLDLAALLPRSRLERTIERAEALRLTDPISLDELLRRYPRRKGTRSLREVVRRGIEPILTRSELEDRFLAFLDARGLPRPRVNVLIEGLEVDFVWPEQPSSSSSTVAKPTPRPRRSNATAREIARSRPPAGASSASPGVSSRTTRPLSRAISADYWRTTPGSPCAGRRRRDP